MEANWSGSRRGLWAPLCHRAQISTARGCRVTRGWRGGCCPSEPSRSCFLARPAWFSAPVPPPGLGGAGSQTLRQLGLWSLRHQFGCLTQGTCPSSSSLTVLPCGRLEGLQGGPRGPCPCPAGFHPKSSPVPAACLCSIPPCRPWSSSVGLRSAGSDFPLPMGVAAHQRGFVRRKRWQPACRSRRNQGLSPSFPQSRCWWPGAPTHLCRPWCGGRPCRGCILGAAPLYSPKRGL